MDTPHYLLATEDVLPFIMETYNENIDALHGAHKSHEEWKNLLTEAGSIYYIVYIGIMPVAWFRMDIENGGPDGIWLGMLQVKREYHRQGIGTYILSAAEALAKQKGYRTLGIHTTEDNLAAKNLYLSRGYEVTKYGRCTTADQKERMGYTFQKNLPHRP